MKKYVRFFETQFKLPLYNTKTSRKPGVFYPEKMIHPGERMKVKV